MDGQKNIRKKCNKCGLNKRLNEFHLHKLSKDGRHPTCARCIRAKKNPVEPDYASFYMPI